jgi:hypothetical protein
VGSGVAKLFNKKLEKMVRKDIQNFKSYIETGVNEKKMEQEKQERSPITNSTTKTLVASAAEGILQGVTEEKKALAIGQF